MGLTKIKSLDLIDWFTSWGWYSQKEMKTNMDFQESRVSGDQAFFSITAKWGKSRRGNGRMAPTFCQFNPNCLPSSTLAISLTGKSNLLEFLCFCFQNCLSESTLKQWQRGCLFRRGKKKITHDSQEACLSKSTSLMRCLPPKHSAVAKGCEMWLITALELWLTSAQGHHACREREARGAAAARISNSRAPFCCLTDDFGITGCSSGQLCFYGACFRNGVFVGSKMGNDGLNKVR